MTGKLKGVLYTEWESLGEELFIVVGNRSSEPVLLNFNKNWENKEMSGIGQVVVCI